MLRIVELLGGKDVLLTTIANHLELAQAVKAGFPAIAVRKVAESLELTSEELEPIISRRTLDRRVKGAQRLTAEESDRLARLARIGALAIDTFGDRPKALSWLRRPNRALGGVAPITIGNTDPGARLIEEVLGRIAHGVFS